VQGDQWLHVAGVYDGTHMRTFVNGVEQGDRAISFQGAGDCDGPLRIGADAATGQFPMNGIIDEVRLSSVGRYSANFTPPTAPFTTDGDTVALWHFDGSGQAVADETAQHDGTLGATDQAEADDPGRVGVPCIGQLR